MALPAAKRRLRPALQESRPPLPVVTPQPLVILYNIPRDAELSIRRALLLLRERHPDLAEQIGKQIQKIEVLFHGARIYLDHQSQGTVELDQNIQEHSHAYIAAALFYAAKRIEQARRGSTSHSLSERRKDLISTVQILTSLEARADEIAAVERTIEELTVDRLKPA